MSRLVRSVAVVGLLVAAPAGAQQLSLTLGGGRVTMTATNVPIRQVLAEWARVGGVTIVNADKIAGPLVTLSLPDVPERQALDALLRGVSGYLLAARPPGHIGASMYDRILILPTSAAPPAPARAASAPPGASGRPQPFMPPAGMQADQDDQPQPDASADAQEPTVQPQVMPMPGGFNRQFPAGGIGGQNGVAGAPMGSGLPVAAPPRGALGGQPGGVPAGMLPPRSGVNGGPGGLGAQVPSANNPFGTPAGSGAPGVVTPVPSLPPTRIVTSPAGEPQQAPATR